MVGFLKTTLKVKYPYLVTYRYGDKVETQEAVYVEDIEDEECKWFDITDIEITLAVIAWMPLPEPYKAESEG